MIMRNANKSPKIPYSAIQGKCKWSRIYIRNHITTKR